MAVVGVICGYFVYQTQMTWNKRTQNHETIPSGFPWTENKEVFSFTSSVSSTWSFDWNLESINIWTNCQFIWSGKVYIWLSVWEFKKLCLWHPCLNKLMHVENVRFQKISIPPYGRDRIFQRGGGVNLRNFPVGRGGNHREIFPEGSRDV